MLTSYNPLKEIPAHNYEGYVWLANNKEPIIVQQKERFDFSQIELDSFILEAWLYCEEEKTAILIRHTSNTQQQIYTYHLDQLPEGSHLYAIDYLSHPRLGAIKKLRFQQLWVPEKDPLCQDLEVLRLKALIFTGFIH